MNILELENKRLALLNSIDNGCSVRERLFLLNDFLSQLINFEDKNVIHSYALEFLGQYLYCLKNYTPFCLPPSESEKIINNAAAISASSLFPDNEAEIIDSIERIQLQLNELNDALNGKNVKSESKVYFPLLEVNDSNKYGILDSVSVKIYSGINEDKFIIIPSESEIEERLSDQVKITWQKALQYVEQFKIKVKGFHKVYISFDKQSGFYVGNSLGAALFLAFVEELLAYYKSAVIVQTKASLAVTGGINLEGKISSTSKIVIKQKVEALFFSTVKYFIFPKADEQFAEDKLALLLKQFPKRELKIIGIEDAYDILNRRNLVDIKKQKAVKRAANFIGRNKLAFSLFFVLLAVFFIHSSIVWDKNPVSYKVDDSAILIKNKYGQVIWAKNIEGSNVLAEDSKIAKVVDIDGDGINEVIITREKSLGTVTCYNNEQKVIWQYIFKDLVESSKIHSDKYRSFLIDTLTIQKNKYLFLTASNIPLYPHAIYSLNLLTGKREDSLRVVWNAGAISDAKIGDFNEDGKPELIGTGGNNGFEKAVFFSINIDDMNYTQFPSPDFYTFKNLTRASFNNYILLPQTDFSYYKKSRYNIGRSIIFFESSKNFEVWVDEDYHTIDGESVIYGFSRNYDLTMIDCGDNFSFERDGLIRQGKLKPPLTNTYEFYNSLKEKIIYLIPEMAANY